ncbi:MAG: peptide-methionine (S)-S-oxide reductase MsrA, partial [Opitutaceae bacterium]
MMRAPIVWLVMSALLSGTATAVEAGDAAQSNTVVLAGGCFWCMEEAFEKVEGVREVISGFAGGDVKNPTYDQVSAGDTGHREVVQVVYDPAKVSYGKLMEVFWPNVDPFDDGGQFCDRGHQYTAAVYYSSPEEKKIAEESKAQAERQLGKPVVTPVLPASEFFPAEDDHQNYYEEHALKYRYYKWRCGRAGRLEE